MIMQMKEYTNELYHHGVKGMKWGVRKDRKATSKGRVNGTVTDKNGKKHEYTTINIKSPKRGGFKSFEELERWGYKEENKIHDDYFNRKISKKQLENRLERLTVMQGRELQKLKQKESAKRGAEFINTHQHRFMDMSILQANQFAMEQATRASINASLQAASLSASGGMNPFMFGMM